MLRTNLLKRTAAFAAALALGAGLFSDSFTQPAIVTTAESESFDITSYAERLKEISEEQERLDNEIEAAQDDIKKRNRKTGSNTEKNQVSK